MTAARVVGIIPLVRVTQVDRVFDYLLPEELESAVKFGSRVRVQFGGRRIDGIVVSIKDRSEYPGKLAKLLHVVSPYPVLTKELWELVEILSTKYLCTKADILRLMLPTRHANTEKDFHPTVETVKLSNSSEKPESSASVWKNYSRGLFFLKALAEKKIPQAIAQQLSTFSLSDYLQTILEIVVEQQKSILILVSDYKKFSLLMEYLQNSIFAPLIVAYYSELGIAGRYGAFLKITTSQQVIVVGNRSAAYAPINNLGLIICLDDNSDNYDEPRFPYFSIREVLITRAKIEDSSLLFLSYGRNIELEYQVSKKVLVDLQVKKDFLKNSLPQTIANGTLISGDNSSGTFSYLPSWIFKVMTKQLAAQDLPILIRVPRKGYILSFICTNCRQPAQCRFCNGPLTQSKDSNEYICKDCLKKESDFTCINCGSKKLSSTSRGIERVAEEMGKAFKNIPLYISGGKHIIKQIPAKKSLVFSTPGAEPMIETSQSTPVKYSTGIILDAYTQFHSMSLDADTRMFNQIINFASLINSKLKQGLLGITVDSDHPYVHYLQTGQTLTLVKESLVERISLKLPPAAVLVAVQGVTSMVEDFVKQISWLNEVEYFGPIALETEDTELSRVILKFKEEDYSTYAAKIYLLYREWLLKKVRKTTTEPKLRLLVNPKDM